MSDNFNFTETAVAIFEGLLVYALWHEHVNDKKRQQAIKERVALNVGITNPFLERPVYGFGDIIASIPDIIDRVREPDSYKDIRTGNEILIVGDPQSGKKSLAYEIARLAEIHQAITVYNPRDPETLLHAKNLIQKKQNRIKGLWKKVSRSVTKRPGELLLLPGLQDVNSTTEEPWQQQLDALIEVAGKLSHLLVIGTTDKYSPTGNIAQMFGTVLEIPSVNSGKPHEVQTMLKLGDLRVMSQEWKKSLSETVQGYLDDAIKNKYVLDSIKNDDIIRRILKVRPSMAEVEDIFAHLMSLAIYYKKTNKQSELVISPSTLKTAIPRVIRPATVAQLTQ